MNTFDNHKRNFGYWFIAALLVLAVGLVVAVIAHPAAARTNEAAPPEDWPGFGLGYSFKMAHAMTLAPNQTVTFTIQLINSSNQPVSASVEDRLPSEVAYVAGSASNGGVYDAAKHTLNWMGVNVPPYGSVALTYQVSQAVAVDQPTMVVNHAYISANGHTVHRKACITLVPENYEDLLYGAHKSASQHKVGPGEVFTYTIHLHNSSTVTTTWNVTDVVPVELEYIDGSASAGGQYDINTRTLTWSGVIVPPASDVELTFQAKPAIEVTEATPVINTATVEVEGLVFHPKTKVVLLPFVVGDDRVKPVVHSLTIDEMDVLTSPTVTLHISATDNVEVKWMYLREWTIVTAPWPHWELTKSSGWIPFQADYPWTLESVSGVHFVGVWVADGSGNVSRPWRRAFDFASLILPATSLQASDMVPYMVYYPKGVEVTATLTPAVGDADIYVWFPHNFHKPDLMSAQSGGAVETLQFVTPREGIYIFLVRAKLDTTYDLAITPAGGPSWLQKAVSTVASLVMGQGPSDPFTPDTELIFTKSGLDPMSSATAVEPGGPHILFMPLLVR